MLVCVIAHTCVRVCPCVRACVRACVRVCVCVIVCVSVLLSSPTLGVLAGVEVKTLILKDSSARSIWTYLTASPCYTTNTKEHDYSTNR